MSNRVLVTGAGGFIGHHLVNYLVAKGYWVRGADIKQPEYEPTRANEFFEVDLRNEENCRKMCTGIDHVYHLAADMGGIGYICGSHAEIARNNTRMNLYMLEASRDARVQRFFFSSTACIYPLHLQKRPDIVALSEDMAHPAQPEEGYGWEKLYMEKLCQYFREDFGLETRVARFHNVYGPLGTWDGGREKAPAATCRKVAQTPNGGVMKVWGDGKQTRSFSYIDDCVEGVHRITMSDYVNPLNLGREEMVTIDELVDIVAGIAGKTILKEYDTSAPQGVRGRNSDNSLIREVLGWEPSISLREGLRPTYAWISQQVAKHGSKSDHTGAILQGTKTVSVVGLGKLGAPMAAHFAARGYKVVGIDLDPKKVAAVNSGIAPVDETGLEDLLRSAKANLTATTDMTSGVRDADMIFVIVPTPSDSTGGFSLEYLSASCESLGTALKQSTKKPVIIVTSTVMPGSMDGTIKKVLEASSGKRCSEGFGLCYSPEFIALGSVIHDFENPDFYLVGESDQISGAKLAEFYRSICQNNAPVRRMSFVNAEITKISVNSFVTMKISFANTLARICENIEGGDVDAVTSAMGCDRRIGKQYLRGAIGFGGPCFPRDNRAFTAFAKTLGLQAPLAEATDSVNRLRHNSVASAVMKASRIPGKVGILGLAYKPETDVVEESAALAIAQSLVDRGFELLAYDPKANETAKRLLEGKVTFLTDSIECIEGAETIVITNPDKAFKHLAPQLRSALDQGKRVVDCWRLFADDLSGLPGYIPLGRANSQSVLETRILILDEPPANEATNEGETLDVSNKVDSQWTAPKH